MGTLGGTDHVLHSMYVVIRYTDTGRGILNQIWQALIANSFIRHI